MPFDVARFRQGVMIMKLHEWCRNRRGAITQIANVCGVVPNSLSRIVRDKAKPSFDLAAKISAATGGEVTIEDLLGELPAGASWSPAQAQAELDLAQAQALLRTYDSLLSPEERALLAHGPVAKRPQSTPAQMRGAA